MYYKLLVKKFAMNVKEVPLLDNEGVEVTEPYKEPTTTIVKVPALFDGQAVKNAEEEYLVTQTFIETHAIKHRSIIPTRTFDTEMTVYQHVSDDGASVIGYYDADGNPFIYDDEDGSAYESKIVARETPDWAK